MSKAGGKQHRERMARRSREQTESVADIGELPAVADPERRERCRHSLLLFLTTYFPNSTGLKPFSDDHRRVIARMERAIKFGGRFANAVYRGFAKTTMSENGGLWAVLYGWRRFVPIFGADQSAADGNINSIKRELEGNDELLADFPEVCYPIRCLEGKAQRQHSQAYRGELTHIRWTADTVVLPTIPGSVASGAVLMARGLTGSNRGLKLKDSGGVQQRPDFVIIDDPQTDESATSPLQVRKRMDTIKRTILKLGSHRKAIAVVMNATVIAPFDLVDQLLDHQKNAAWQGERIKMVNRWSDAHDSLWLRDYATIRTTYNPDDPDAQSEAHAAATAFYREHRAAMDAGCLISWEHCFDEETELSAIQHAYNALIDDGPEVFASEYQNDPLSPAADATVLTADAIARKVNGYGRGQVPQDASILTAFIDVQKDALYYAVAGWQDNFCGDVLDYGTHPDQRQDLFDLRDVRHKLADVHTDMGLEATIFAGLSLLADKLLSRQWLRSDGAELSIGLCLVDANWGDSTDIVYDWCRQTAYRSIVLPSHGVYVGAASTPINARKAKAGERRGLNWRIPPVTAGRVVRHVLFDTNYWKSFAHKRLATKPGDAGCLSLFKATPQKHRMISEHLTAEFCIATEGRGRQVHEWKEKPHRPDNHFFDCVAGAAVAAAIQGCRLGHQGERPKARPRPNRSAVKYL